MSHRVNGDILETTKTSLRILELLKELEGATSTELSDHLDMPKSTLHIHLNTLREMQYVFKEGTQYHTGLKLLTLGEHARQRRGIEDIAKSHVHQMTQDTRFEADFLLCENGKMFLLYGEIGAATDPNFQIGREFYMHSTGTGKAILAEWSSERVEAVIDRWGLPERTENTIVRKDRLHEELIDTADRGFGINDEECMDGYRTIGAVVHDPLGNAIGGLGIGGPTYRIDDHALHETLPDILTEAVADFEDELTNDTSQI